MEKRIKSIAFSTDVANHQKYQRGCDSSQFIRFTPQAAISQSIISISDVPVFVGVGGGLTGGKRSVRLALQAEHQGAYGRSGQCADSRMRSSRRSSGWLTFRSFATIASVHTDVRRKHEGGSRYFKCIRRCRHRIDGSRDPEGVSGRCHYREPEDRLTNQFWRRSRRRPMRSRTRRPSNGELFARTMKKIQGESIPDYNKRRDRRENIIFLFGSAFYFCVHRKLSINKKTLARCALARSRNMSSPRSRENVQGTFFMEN